MKRQLPSTSSEDEPQRNVRSCNPFTPSMPRQSDVSLEQPHGNLQPGAPSVAPNRHADHQSPTSVSGENISSTTDKPQGLQALSGSTSPHVRRRNARICNRFARPMAPNRHVDHQSPTSVSGEYSSSSSDTPQGLQALARSTSPRVPQGNARRNDRIRNPVIRSMTPHLRVFNQQERQRVVSLEQPHGFQSGVQSVAPNQNADHQNPTLVSGESISDSSDTETEHNLHPFWTLVPPVAPRWTYTRVILSSIALSIGTESHLSEHPENRSSQGQTSNDSQYQNPQMIQAVRNHNIMDVDRMIYEELLALEERIGKVNTGVKTSELSKFVKNIICCGEQDEAEQCIICMEQYVDADIMGQLKCGHEYHFSCIGKWMEEQVVCPICRQRAAHFEQ